MRSEARAVRHIADKECTLPVKHAALLTDSKHRHMWVDAVDEPLLHHITNEVIDIVHAEVQALVKAGMHTVPCDMFVTRVPCTNCCKYLHLSSVRTVFVVKSHGAAAFPDTQEAAASHALLKALGVHVRFVVI